MPLIDYTTELKNTAGNDTAIANAVWTAALRSLTVDPATDAGAATLVWNSASRPLTVDPATDAGLATLVWTHTPRNLTGLGGGTIIAANSINQSVPNGSFADLRPAAGFFRFLMFGKVGNVATVWALAFYDGVTAQPVVSIPSLGALLEPGMIGTNTFGFIAQNNGTIADSFNSSGFDWSQ